MSEKTKQAINKMKEEFPLCPLCSAKDSYKASRQSGGSITCKVCKARWISPSFLNDEALTELELRKVGKTKQARQLYYKRKTVEFWKLLDLDIYSPGKEMFGSKTEWWLQEIFDKKVERLLGEAWEANQEKDEKKYDTAIRDLKQLGDLAQAEIRGIAKGIHSGRALYLAHWYLGVQGDERWIKFLGNNLHNPDKDLRRSAVFFAMTIQRDTGIYPLIPDVIDKLKTDESVWVRAGAADWLSYAGPDPNVIDALIEALIDTERPEEGPVMAGSLAGLISAAAKAKTYLSVDELAARSLVSMGDKIIEPLLQALNSEDRELRAKIVAFLVNVNDERVFKALISSLGDSYYKVRRTAARLLGTLGDKRSLKSLKELRNDEDKSVSRAARIAIKEIEK